MIHEYFVILIKSLVLRCGSSWLYGRDQRSTGTIYLTAKTNDTFIHLPTTSYSKSEYFVIRSLSCTQFVHGFLTFFNKFCSHIPKVHTVYRVIIIIFLWLDIQAYHRTCNELMMENAYYAPPFHSNTNYHMDTLTRAPYTNEYKEL